MTEYDRRVSAPEEIIYNQIERIHVLRAQGHSAIESISLLSKDLTSLRTPEFDRRLEELKRAPDADEIFLGWYEALIQVLVANNLWVRGRKKRDERELLVSAR